MHGDKFKALSKKGKYREVQDHGNHIANRYYQSYEIHLYQVRDLLVEVWWKLGLNQIYWIEIVGRDRVELYADEVKLNLKL